MSGNQYGNALHQAKMDLQGRDALSIASLSGSESENLGGASRLRLRLWENRYFIDHPGVRVYDEVSGREPAQHIQILILHYLVNADGFPLTNNWISFRELPGGIAFELAFKQHACFPLARVFGRDVEAFKRASELLDGEPLAFGDASYRFPIFPRQWVAVVLHTAVESFPASASILFDEAASHYLPTEDWAVVATLISSQLISAIGNVSTKLQGSN